MTFHVTLPPSPPLLVRLKETKDELLEVKESLESTNREKVYQINNEGTAGCLSYLTTTTVWPS